MKQALVVVLLLQVIIINTNADTFRDQTLLNRLIRAANKKQECRYEKEAWEECDPSTGIQRRALRLKSTRSSSTNCEPVKFIQRPCKRTCRYSKGEWSECRNGLRYRLDNIKPDGGSSGCESVRNITKTCKEHCRYSKSEWSPCEDGVKVKTFTLITDDPNTSTSCEPTKLIKKSCGDANPKARQKQRGRKNNNQPPINS